MNPGASGHNLRVRSQAAMGPPITAGDRRAMRKRMAIIHMGTAKTGSASIHRVLKAQRDVLQGLGFALRRSPGNTNHFRLPICATRTKGPDQLAPGHRRGRRFYLGGAALRTGVPL